MATKDVLSEGELDALMDSVSSGDVPLATPEGDGSYQAFDFSTREQELLARIPALVAVNEKHALLLAELIEDQFNAAVEVQPEKIRLLKAEEVVVSVSERSAINLLEISPLNGKAFVVFEGDLLSYFVNLLFGGGSGQSGIKHSQIELTPTEKWANSKLLNGFAMALEQAWLEKVEVHAVQLSLETDPEVMQAPADAQLLQFAFALSINEWSSVISLYIPYSSFEPLRPRFGSDEPQQSSKSDARWLEDFKLSLLSVDVEISGLFASRSASISEVLNYKKGSIIPLQTPTEVVVCVDGKPHFVGEHGESSKKKSIKVTQVLK